jgi:hypothetical protein
MNLTESMTAAAQGAPLGESTVDIDAILRREHRAAVARRAGIGGAVLAAAIAAALAVPALNAAPNARGDSPPAATSSTPATHSAAGTIHLTAAEVFAVYRGRATDSTFVIVFIGLTPAPISNPCVASLGGSTSRYFVPAPEDTCTEVTRQGRAIWIRRWGYSPTLRPWTDADSQWVSVSVQRSNGKVLTIGITNTGPGPGFDISDEELVKLALLLWPPLDE